MIISIALLKEPIKEEGLRLRSYKNVSEMYFFSIPEWDWSRFIKVGKEYEVDYILPTLLPGNKNNLIIAGHNRDTVFHKLHQLKKGMIVVLDRQGKNTVYKVTKKVIVNPDEIEYLEETDQEQLTLITCTKNDQKRLIVICSKVET